jgi:beta-glucanase (GH16 family)
VVREKFPSGSLLFLDPLDCFQGKHWYRSDGYTLADSLTGWRDEHVSFGSGMMSLRLDEKGCNADPQGCSGQRYASGQYQTLQPFGYGTFETSMRAAKGCGIISSFFVFYGRFVNKMLVEQQEFDFEFFGKDPKLLQTNFIMRLDGDTAPTNHEKVHVLPFDASQGKHVYKFVWAQDSLEWYVDGIKIRTETSSASTPPRDRIPSKPGQIIVNVWGSCGSWAACPGPAGTSPQCYDDESGKAVAFYDYIYYLSSGITHINVF